jgi:hypothetical protein
MAVKCGNCKQYHPDSNSVRACYKGQFVRPRIDDRIQDRPDTVQRIKAAAAQLPQVKSLRFALLNHDRGGDEIWNFYQVDRPQTGRWQGYTFLKIQASDDLHNIRNLDRVANVLEELVKRGVENAVSDYGHQIGSCGICHRTLTDPVSIDRGIGPVCAGKVGW